MQFRIAETFTDALARLTGQEQKAAKTSAFDLQMNPAAPGLQFHRIEKSRDKKFWSIRVDRDLRIIIHKTVSSILLVYVGHHDKAYEWAERRRIEAHPRTGAIQIVEVRERVEEVAPSYPFDPVTPAAPVEVPIVRPCFDKLSREQLLSIGVPEDWIADVLAASEDRFFGIADHLPREAAEALLEFAATGTLPVLHLMTAEVVAEFRDPYASPEELERIAEQQAFRHPDALRRFRVIESVEELRQALDYPWDKWMVFLHPSQRDIIERRYTGPVRVAGSAGTGKTVVALHRAARLAKRYPSGRVLLTTFSQPLATRLDQKLKILAGDASSAIPRIMVTPIHGVAEELYQLAIGRRPNIASDEIIRGLLSKTAESQNVTEFTLRFLVSEWSYVVDAWQLEDESAYARVPRLGRRNRLGTKQRARLWTVFAAVRKLLVERGVFTWARVCAEVAKHYVTKTSKPFSHIVVDEAQDLGIAELRLLAAIADTGPNSLFFAGDLGQRIFQQPFSWLALGIDVRGRSQILKVNYRTSHQIRLAADRLLPKVLRDVDGLEEQRNGTVSVFNGPDPEIIRAASAEAEAVSVAAWIDNAIRDGFAPREIGVFVRSHAELDRAREVAKLLHRDVLILADRGEEPGERISIGTMHGAKGLEFKAVAVMACDDEVLPLQARIESVADEVELDDVYETERQLLYVACTRARDRLLVSGVSPASEFIEDMLNASSRPSA